MVDEQRIEYQRRVDTWLVDWRAEIEGVERYARVPVTPWEATVIDPDHVVPRLGPELTVIARYAKTQFEGSEDIERAHGVYSEDTLLAKGRAWGALEALARGLGVHLGLSVEHADWLARAMTGHIDRDRRRRSR